MTEADLRRDGAPATQRVVLVTGPSGAGRSTAIHALEDLGYEAIDNLPLSLVPRLLDGPALNRPVALGIDVRNREFSAFALIEMIDRLTRAPEVAPEILYLDCRPAELQRRYGETRRRHPLALAEDPALGIAQEIDILTPIRARADVLIDTTGLSPHELKAEIARWFDQLGATKMGLSVHSFSYKRGTPRGLDMLFDCRFLKNPHWEAALRSKDGRADDVAEYIASDPNYAPFCAKVLDLLRLLLPAQIKEGKSHLAIGFGCTGGQHRSVTVVENIGNALAAEGWQVSKRHRELERRAAAQPGDTAG